jgi:hypothetical protein
MKTPETDEAEEAEETVTKVPAQATTRDHVCGHCLRVFPTQMKKGEHMAKAHQEATAWVPTDH